MKRDKLGSIKTYRRHYCSKKHRTYSGAAKCLWSRNVFRIEGDGPYVLVHWTRDNARPWKTGRIIELYETEEDLARVVGYHATGSCCGSCRGYETVKIDLESIRGDK